AQGEWRRRAPGAHAVPRLFVCPAVCCGAPASQFSAVSSSVFWRRPGDGQAGSRDALMVGWYFPNFNGCSPPPLQTHTATHGASWGRWPRTFRVKSWVPTISYTRELTEMFSVAQLGFSQELRLLGVFHKSKQPLAALALFFVRLLRQLLASALHLMAGG